MNKFNVITISEGAAGMRSQIEGLASLISEDYKNFDLKIKSFFKYLPIELIPSSSFAYINLSSLKIEISSIKMDISFVKNDFSVVKSYISSVKQW